MDLNKLVSNFEEFYRHKFDNKLNDELNIVLGLPFYDVEVIKNDLIRPFITVSNAISTSLLQVYSKVTTDGFHTTVNFDQAMVDHLRYARENPVKSTIDFLNNLYNQWADIAIKNGISIEDIQLSKESGIANLSTYLKPFDLANEFLMKYRTVEDYYIRNKHDPDKEMVDFYKSELDTLLDTYNEVLNKESVKFFIGFKNDDSLKNHLRSFHDVILTIKERIQLEAPLSIASLADKYIAEQVDSTSDVAQFLNSKQFDDKIVNHIKFTKSQRISEMLSFTDDTSVWKDQNDNYHKVSSLHELFDRVSDVVESAIDYKLRKKPKIAKFFKEIYLDESPTFEQVNTVVDNYLDNENILKNMSFDMDLFKNKSLEGVDDAMNASIREYKINRYAHSILSNKYKHLLSPMSVTLFKELYDAKITETQIQDLIGKKLAAIKTSEDFEIYLGKIVDQFSGFSEFAISEKYGRVGIAPIYKKDNVLVFEIDTYKQSEEFGSASWCISRTEHYFNTYTANESRQFFIYDFNKSEKDNHSMIGITIQKDGKFKTQHAKNDDKMTVNDLLNDIKKTIILNDIEKFELSDDYKIELGIVLNNKTALKPTNLSMGLR